MPRLRCSEVSCQQVIDSIKNETIAQMKTIGQRTVLKLFQYKFLKLTGYNGQMVKSELTKIPGVGNKMAEHLIRAGFPTISSLKGKSPDEIYAADCHVQGMPVDRCALYCYRLAAHYADHNGQLPDDKQNWWDWKD